MDRILYGNTVQSWLTAAVILVAVVAAEKMLRAVVLSRLRSWARRTRTYVDDLAGTVLSATRSSLVAVVGLYAASLSLTLAGRVEEVLGTAAALALLAQIGLWGGTAIGFLVSRIRSRGDAVDAETATAVGAMGFLGRLVLWSFLLLMAIDNLGYDVTALVTGLGIGGIAVALALQNVLGDLFASLSIILDKPFVIGDTLSVGDYQGTVERIGLKTTRLRSVTGEELIFSNKDLLESRVQNFGRMRERRHTFQIGLTYDTPPETAARIPGMVREVLDGEEVARFDRSHFKSFGDSALVFESVYYVADPSYATLMDVQERVNLELLRRLEAAGVEFAYPTRTVVLQGTGFDVPGEEG